MVVKPVHSLSAYDTPGIGLTLSLYPTCASSRAASRSFCGSNKETSVTH